MGDSQGFTSEKLGFTVLTVELRMDLTQKDPIERADSFRRCGIWLHPRDCTASDVIEGGDGQKQWCRWALLDPMLGGPKHTCQDIQKQSPIIPSIKKSMTK